MNPKGVFFDTNCVGILLLNVACKQRTYNVQSNLNEFFGEYEPQCKKMVSESDFDESEKPGKLTEIGSTKHELNFSEKNLINKDFTYNNSTTCEGLPDELFEVIASYEFGKHISGYKSAYEINILDTEETYTRLSEKGSPNHNRENKCSFKTTGIGIPVSCPKYEDKHFTIMRMEGDKLFAGKRTPDLDGRTKE